MSKKKTEFVSLSVRPEERAKLRSIAARRNVKIWEVVRDLLKSERKK